MSGGGKLRRSFVFPWPFSRLSFSRPWSLRRRLVLGIAAVVATVLLISGGAAVFGMRIALTFELDRRLAQVASLQDGALPAPPNWSQSVFGEDDGPDDSWGSGSDKDGRRHHSVGLETPGQRQGTVIVQVREGVDPVGVVSTDFAVRALSAAQVSSFTAVIAGEKARTVQVPGLGSYRAVARQVGATTVITGLSLAEISHTVSFFWKVLVGTSLLGLLLAAGAGAVLVRRELRPLERVAATAREVAALPLDSGSGEVPVRVDAADANPVTEVGQVGAALNGLLSQVEQSLRARHRSEMQVRQFVSDASHELRTPLASIRGYTELARSAGKDFSADGGEGSAGQEVALERIWQESGRMQTLVEDLLLLARLDEGVPLRQDEVDLSQLATESLADAHAADRALGSEHIWELALPVDAAGELDIAGGIVRGDEDRLRQVLVNLLANARTHTPPGTKVLLRVAAMAGGVEVQVSDNGLGIDPQLQGRMFHRFTRGDTARSRAGGSSGLGLSIVEAIVAAHGGSISVVSVPGSTVFTVFLPRQGLSVIES